MTHNEQQMNVDYRQTHQMHLASQFYRESEPSFDLVQRALGSLNPYAFVHFSPDVGTLL